MNFEILEKLNAFAGVKFEEEKHIYTAGDKALTSVTTLLKQYEPEKDWDQIAMRYAAKNGETQEYWRDKWKQEGIIAAEKGSQFHLYAENSLANKVYRFDIAKLRSLNVECDKIDWFEPDKVVKKLKMMWDLFWFQACGNLVPVRSEYVVADLEAEIGGMVDQLFWNKKMQELQIWDWKTSKKIARHNDYSKLTGPLSHLDECEFNKYSLQLGTYKNIIERILGINLGTSYIGWFHESNDTYKIIKTIALEKEVKAILGQS